jgi:hypothetical protein
MESNELFMCFKGTQDDLRRSEKDRGLLEHTSFSSDSKVE